MKLRRGMLAAALTLAALLGASVAWGATPLSGTYSGKTSQHGRPYRVRFSVVGNQLKSSRIVWRARCASGQFLSRGTKQGSTRITIRNGSWSNSGRYSASLPHSEAERAGQRRA